MGQKQTLEGVKVMSALPPTKPRDVRFVPKADSCTAAINTEFRTGIAGFSPVVDVG